MCEAACSQCPRGPLPSGGGEVLSTSPGPHMALSLELRPCPPGSGRVTCRNSGAEGHKWALPEARGQVRGSPLGASGLP